ncbi:hypothetical protein K466DRAFT_668626 [Polyporus arcularius HHB13444]|uniref:Uncharacterized protein n=1 Tax=Polyporus arcularius HHB13444 TaxID=1314778 RepID=A0A5C3NNA9_9APHY|nr:hypothetical protein K466DRAFT_668626 [Polyporus arcularius HHB13444]
MDANIETLRPRSGATSERGVRSGRSCSRGQQTVRYSGQLSGFQDLSMSQNMPAVRGLTGGTHSGAHACCAQQPESKMMDFSLKRRPSCRSPGERQQLARQKQRSSWVDRPPVEAQRLLGSHVDVRELCVICVRARCRGVVCGLKLSSLAPNFSLDGERLALRWIKTQSRAP